MGIEVPEGYEWPAALAVFAVFFAIFFIKYYQTLQKSPQSGQLPYDTLRALGVGMGANDASLQLAEALRDLTIVQRKILAMMEAQHRDDVIAERVKKEVEQRLRDSPSRHGEE